MTKERIIEVLLEMGCHVYQKSTNVSVWFILPGLNTDDNENVFLVIGPRDVSYYKEVRTDQVRLRIVFSDADWVKIPELVETQLRNYIESMLLQYKKCVVELLKLEIENESI